MKDNRRSLELWGMGVNLLLNGEGCMRSMQWQLRTCWKTKKSMSRCSAARPSGFIPPSSPQSGKLTATEVAYAMFSSLLCLTLSTKLSSARCSLPLDFMLFPQCERPSFIHIHAFNASSLSFLLPDYQCSASFSETCYTWWFRRKGQYFGNWQYR